MMRKHRKNLWKTARPYLLTELIAAVMAVLLAVTVYYSTRAAVLSEIEQNMSEFERSSRNLSLSAENCLFQLQILREHYIRGSEYEDCSSVAVYCDYGHVEINGADENRVVGDGLYLDGSIVTLSASYSEEVSSIVSSVAEGKKRIWDLRKYFPKEDIDALTEFIPLDYFGLSDWTKFTLQEVRGRETDGGHYLITGITVLKEGDKLVLRSPEFQQTDEEFPETYRTESGREGTIGVHLNIMPQNPEMSKLVNTFRLTETGRGKYYWKVIDHSNPLIGSQYGVNRRIEEIREGDGGEVVYTYDGNETPSVEYFVLIDDAQIVRGRSYRKILCIAVLFQGYALIAMVLVNAYRRKKEERRLLQATFVNAMAHELKTPAAVVRNTAEYLATGAKPEKQAHYIKVLTRESESMGALLNRMLTYTRVLDGNVEFKPVKTNLSMLVQSTLVSYSDLIAEKGMTANLSVKPAVIIDCDPALMGMVIDNLISNAVRYGEAGSNIIIRLDEQCFAVWNKADALTEKELESIWTPMFVTDRSAEDSKTGGMGLAISAGILDRHGFAYGAFNARDGLLFQVDLTETKNRNKQKASEPGNLSVIWGWLCVSSLMLIRLVSDNFDWEDVIFTGIWMIGCIIGVLTYIVIRKRKKKRRVTGGV